MPRRIAILAVLAASMTGVATLGPPAPLLAQEGHTLHDRLGPTTRQALANFLQTWHKDDFVTVGLLLSPKARQSWLTEFAHDFSFGRFFPPGARKTVDDSYQALSRPEFEERSAYFEVLFDNVMTVAEGLGALPFTLGPKFKALEQPGATDQRVDFAVTTGGRPATITVSAIKLSFGPWKVEHIQFPGDDPQLLPWGYRVQP
jgi:hypothetical protein